MTIRQFLGVVEMRTKLVSISTLAGATVYALRVRGRLDFPVLALTLPAVLLVDMGTTAFNSFFDYWRGVDRGKPLREEDKVLVTEGVPALSALFIAAGCYLAAICLGIALAFSSGAWVIALGLLCLAAGFLYNGGPWPISRTPLGELVSGLFLGSVLFLIVYRLQTGSWSAGSLLASLPGSFFIASILSVNNACDALEDRASGRRTLAILLGHRRAALLPPGLGAIAYASTMLLALLGILPLGCAATGAAGALASVFIYRGMLRRGFSHESKSASMRSVLAAFLLWSLCFVGGLALGPSLAGVA